MMKRPRLAVALLALVTTILLLAGLALAGPTALESAKKTAASAEAGVKAQESAVVAQRSAFTASESSLANARATLVAAKETVAALEPKEEEPPKEEPPPSGETWHSFTASNPMPAGQQPFGPESFINRKIPANPEPTANGAEIAKFVGQPNNIWTDGGYDRPWYYASETDPVLEVTGVKYGTWANGLKIHVPAGAKPAPAPCWPATPTSCKADHHMGVVERDGQEYDFWAVEQIAGGKLVAGGAGYASNFGTSSGVSERADGSTASGFNNMTGVIRSEELKARHITHALSGPVHLTRAGCHVGPAKGSDGTSTSANAPCQGQRLCLEYTNAEIAAKHFPPWKETILVALDCHEYGFYVDDSGGGGGFTIKIEGPIDRMAFGLPNPFNEALKGEPGLSEATGAGGKAYIMNIASEVDWTRLRAIQ